MHRLALYVFWEKNGIVHDHVTWYLNGLKEVAQDIMVIVNGLLSANDRRKLEKLGVDILVRDNIGYDFAAWKAALNHKGWAALAKYDEIILCNCSCYGPVYPLSEMFGVMEKRTCDFWGINRQPDAPEHLVGPKDARFPMTEHIQSYFYVFRSNALCAPAFRQWWDELEVCPDYWDEIRLHEMRFSPWLELHGLVGDTFMDFEKYKRLSPQGDANFNCPDTQLIEDRNPLVKRRLIFGSSEACRRTLATLWQMENFPFLMIVRDMKRNTDCSFKSRLKNRLQTLFPGKSARRSAVRLWKIELISQLDTKGDK